MLRQQGTPAEPHEVTSRCSIKGNGRRRQPHHPTTRDARTHQRTHHVHTRTDSPSHPLPTCARSESKMAAEPTSALIEQAKAKTEAYLPRIDAQRAHTVGSTDLEGAFPYEKKYVGAYEWVGG